MNDQIQYISEKVKEHKADVEQSDELFESLK